LTARFGADAADAEDADAALVALATGSDVSSLATGGHPALIWVK
jgi:hypothetical protein